MIFRISFNSTWSFLLSVVVLTAVGLWQPDGVKAAVFRASQEVDVLSLFVPVALKCSRISKQNGREYMTNVCGSCRIVSIQRMRPGASAPISRTVTMPPKSKVTLSFRGPGQSRVTSDVPCKAAAPSSGSAGSDGKRCIQLARTANGLALANACGQCRMAVVERLGSDGGKRMQTLLVDGHKAIGLPAKGASSARILMEKNCR